MKIEANFHQITSGCDSVGDPSLSVSVVSEGPWAKHQNKKQ